MFKRHSLALIAVMCGALGLGLSVVQAQTIPPSAFVDAGAPAEAAGSAAPQATSTTVTVTTQPAPADSLHNPVDDPLAAVNDVRQAKKQGWALAILAAVIMLTAGFAKASVKWPSAPLLSTINKHKTVIFFVAGAGTVATSSYNALALGGSWYAVLMAAGGAVLAFISSLPSEAK